MEKTWGVGPIQIVREQQINKNHLKISLYDKISKHCFYLGILVTKMKI